MGWKAAATVRMGSVAALALTLLGGAPGAGAQPVEAGVFGARGDGPTPAVAVGLDLRVGLPWVALVGEASTWGTWGVDCPASIPDSFRCSAGGEALLAGLRVTPSPAWPVRPYVEGKIGTFGTSPIPPRDHRPGAWSAEAGIRIGLPGILALELGGRRIQVDDRRYEEVFAEELAYSMVTLRVMAEVW